MPTNRDKIRCTATNRDGTPCKAWAVHGTSPPRCSAHAGRNAGAGAPAGNQNRRAHGFYSRVLTAGELADLVTFADDLSLADEIAIARVTLRRAMERLTTDLETDELTNLAKLTLAGTRTVARLLRDQRALSGEAADGIAGAIAQALDELGTEWGIEL